MSIANAPDTLDRLRADKSDLMARMLEGKLTVLGFGLGTAPVSDYHWDRDTPQKVADHFLLEWQPPKPSSILWPLAEHWHFERNLPQAWIPQWMLTNTTATFYFRTHEGGMGLMRITAAPGSAGHVAIRYKLVRPGSGL